MQPLPGKCTDIFYLPFRAGPPSPDTWRQECTRLEAAGDGITAGGISRYGFARLYSLYRAGTITSDFMRIIRMLGS